MENNILISFIKKRGISKAQAARELDITRVHFGDVCRQKAQAGPKLAQRIEEWSGGEVLKSDLRPDLWPIPEGNSASTPRR